MWDISTRPLTWDPISRSHVGDPHIDNHVEPRGLTLHAGPRGPPSSRGAKGTHPSRGSTVRARSLALIPCRIIRETGHTTHFQQHRYCPQLGNYHLHNPSGVGFYHKRLRY
ncbi:hypothetical protein C1H46_037574 [Malus baccata]|uniref:Uncharacterized protein n=1 Tax=Malus baccata TaxID=106549 RepID=A0A540KRN5_MALBA|nr:hypothetical protein C1H46_037574 [Malus baccata]